MDLRISVPARDISINDLFQVFQSFCESVGIDYSIRDKIRLKSRYQEFQNQSLDYRPIYGAKFFAENFDEGISRFHGYYDYSQITVKEQNSRFEQLVLEYFSKKSE